MSQPGSSSSNVNSTQKGSTGARSPKKLIVACDGTWQDSNSLLQHPTNITRIARAIRSFDDDNHEQVVYYQAGVGTAGGLINRVIGGAIGRGLAEHVQEAYAFLANNYADHDDVLLRDAIFLIGFSRGAFTARSVSGLLGAVGLLKKTSMQYFYDIFEDYQHAGERDYQPKFFDKYFDNDPEALQKHKPDDALAHVPGADNVDKYMDVYRRQLVRLGLTQEVTVKSIGVFETVGSLGIPVNPVVQRILPFLPSYFREYAFYDTRIGCHVETGFQALALDERRAPYRPALWEKPDDCKTYFKQVWFPGAHSNVGGGGHTQTGISDLTIAWMMDHLAGHSLPPSKTFNSLDWISFDAHAIDRFWDQRLARHEHRFKEHKTRAQQVQGWSLSFVSNSYNMFSAILGKKVRTPGEYHFTSYINGREDPNRLLKNTNEHVHASVRARILLKGRAPEPDWDTAFPHGINVFPWIEQVWYKVKGKTPKGDFWPLYQPTARGQALHDWQEHVSDTIDTKTDHDAIVEDGKASKPFWHYNGKKQVESHEMPEDTLGPYELMLLSKAVNRDQIVVDDQGQVKQILAHP